MLGVITTMCARLSLLFALVLVLTLTPTSLVSTSANTNLEIQAITDAKAGSVNLTFNSKIAKASVVTYQITAKPTTLDAASYSKTFTRKVSGYISQRITPLTPGTNYKFKVTIKTSNKKVFNSADFSFYTASTRPNVPVITKAIETDADEAVVYFDAPNNDGQTPVLYYTAKAYPGYATGITLQQGSGSITFTGLTKSTTYRFTVTAHNINGTSVESLLSEPVTTLANKIVRVIPATSSGGSTVTAPAFTLSRTTETRFVNYSLAGYSITETGAPVTSYAISPTPPSPLTFNASTGRISGTPTETRTATTYTITGTSASGETATATYQLRVTGDIGDTGPGGGKIFYYSSGGFICGPTRAATCKYLEAAPSLWAGGAGDPVARWANGYGTIDSPDTATATAIGWGYFNTKAILKERVTDTNTAAALADSHTVTVEGVVFEDWYLPSEDELKQMQSRIGLTGGFTAGRYWSSTDALNNDGRSLPFTTGNAGGSGKLDNSLYVRPIRAL
jgi:hypothetical protein